MLGGTMYLHILWPMGVCTPQDENMDFLVCKELLLHGNLSHSSLHARPVANNITSTLILLEVKNCERISAMLHSKRMFAVPTASTLERHSIYDFSRHSSCGQVDSLLDTRPLQPRQKMLLWTLKFLYHKAKLSRKKREERQVPFY
jgi:hypothetical protein